ncbi:MAG: tetratricopeptide repeat protein [Vicinamibacterales bacterium]
MKRMTYLAGLAAAVLLVAPVRAEQDTAQKLFEKGAFAQVTDRVANERAAGSEDPASTYLAGLALEKLDRNQDARAEFARLSNGSDETWKAIGQSSIGLLDNALDEALAEGQRARDLDGNSGFAFYQLGLVQIKRGDFDAASQTLDRAAELMPDFAYAHYQAGVAHQREKRFNRMAEHFQAFLKLAPEAPERRQVQLALNALRG